MEMLFQYYFYYHFLQVRQVATLNGQHTAINQNKKFAKIKNPGKKKEEKRKTKSQK